MHLCNGSMITIKRINYTSNFKRITLIGLLVTFNSIVCNGNLSINLSNNERIDSIINIVTHLYAKKEYYQAIDVIENFVGNNSSSSNSKMLNVYLYLGANYLHLGNYSRAIDCYNKAELFIPDEETKAYFIHYGKAIVHRCTGNYAKAIQLLDNAINTIKNNDYYKKNNMLWELGKAHFEKGNYKQAIIYFEKSIQIALNHQSSNLDHYYNSCALAYQKLGKYTKAESFYLQSIKYNSDNPNSQFSIALAYMNLGNLKVVIKEYKLGLDYLLKAKKLYIDTYGYKNPYVARCLFNIGEYYASISCLDSALIYYQKSLIAKIRPFEESSISSNPEFVNILPDKDILDILKAKANSLHQRWFHFNLIQDLINAIKTYELLTELISKMRMGYLLDQSSLDLSAREKETYLKIIDAYVNMFRYSKDKEHLEKAFIYSDKVKHATFKANLLEINAKQQGNVPDSLLKQEKYLKQEIASYRKLIHDEVLITTPDSIKLTEWNTELFNAYQEQEKLIRELESNYESYYRIKYSNSHVDIRQLQQKLSIKDALVDYTLSDSVLYTFVVTNNDIQLITKTIDSVFFNRLKDYKDVMYTHKFLDFIRFKNASYYLYTKLIQPIEKDNKLENLVIVPDEVLAYLSFDGLLRKPYDVIDYRFRELDYIFQDYSFHYLYFPSMLLYEKKGRTKKNKLVAFAPSYVNSEYISLDYALKEATEITKICNGDLYINEKATKQNFKEQYQDYNLIHLSMHGETDSVNPSAYSSLVFFNDELLYNYEVANMEFNADMAVLSACNTGFGTLYKGEGMVSMARNLLQSGCSAVAVSLWEGRDLPNYNIYRLYYRYLKRGMTKSKALQKAKIQHLKQAGDFEVSAKAWSGIIIIGSNAPVYSAFKYYSIRIILLLLILCLVIFSSYKIRTSRR